MLRTVSASTIATRRVASTSSTTRFSALLFGASRTCFSKSNQNEEANESKDTNHSSSSSPSSSSIASHSTFVGKLVSFYVSFGWFAPSALCLLFVACVFLLPSVFQKKEKQTGLDPEERAKMQSWVNEYAKRKVEKEKRKMEKKIKQQLSSEEGEEKEEEEKENKTHEAFGELMFALMTFCAYVVPPSEKEEVKKEK